MACTFRKFELKRAMEILHEESSEADSSSDDTDLPEVLMDQTTQDCFSKEVFHQMFWLHMTCPLGILFYLAAGQGKLLASTSIWPPHNTMDVFWIMVPLLVYVNIALFVIYKEQFVADNISATEIIFLPLVALIIHRSMIALKYSGLSHVEYQRWRNAPVRKAKQWGRQIQLLSTWLPLPDQVLLMEIQKACRMQGADLHSLFFHHEVKCETSWRIWNVWREIRHVSREDLNGEIPFPPHTCDLEASGPIEYGVYTISTVQMLHMLWRIAIDHVVEFNRVQLVGFWAMLPALVPAIWRAVACAASKGHAVQILKAALGSTSPVIFCVVTSGFLCYIHILLAGLFAVMAIVHYKRMHLVLESICRLTRPLFCMWPNLPQAQLNGAVGLENMRAVLGCFEVSLRLGGRYQARVEAYVATLALGASIGMGFVLVGVVVGVHNQMNSFTVVVLSLVSGFTVIMFRVIYFGSKANENFPQLSNNICRARWRNASAKSGGAADEECEQAMSLAMERLSILAATEPVNIAGTIPTLDLGYSMVSVVGTLMLFVVGKLFNWDIPA